MSDSLPDPFSGLDLLSSSVLFLAPDFTIRHLNPAAESLLAIGKRGCVGIPLGEILDDCTGAFQSALENAAKYGWNYTGQGLEIRRNSGKSDSTELHLNYAVNPVESVTPGLIVELWPIEHQVRATREERLQEQQQASRELIRNLAHEIKNPLGGIRGAAQLLERELNNPNLREYTQVIIKEADRLQELMKHLLSPHRPMRPGPVNIHEVIERVRSLLIAEFPKTLTIRRDYDTSLPELIADREQLIQAVLNVARNAAQAIGEQARNADGRITLRTRVARQVTLTKRRHRLALSLQVIDNGPGIPENIRKRMFFPLVSGREGGSGLGLTLAQSFIHQHQGVIECESRPGHTCFTIVMPLSLS
ncbi:MAG: PAS domain-containing sensor histidine kinase [Candidatus Accumulibacter sp.]|jgi:two-component system nitrogen regulation sensor histidine kinase GlnL|nr:PAS domain-containing sensor histidine kinase [Accumulibacter sp.]